MTDAIIQRMAGEVGARANQIAAVAKLLGEGCTVPFIARYRKEAHGNLDEVAILKIQERLGYYTELEERKAAILESIDGQGKLTPELRGKIEGCYQKSALEDLYQPYKPRRRTRADVAREAGLEPLAERIWNGEKVTAEAVELQGARDIIAERIADMAEVRGYVRNHMAAKGVLHSEAAAGKTKEPTKFEDYYDYEEPIAAIPGHRYLAIRRGQHQGVLWVKYVIDSEAVLDGILQLVKRNHPEVRLAAADALKRLIAPACEIDVALAKKQEADRQAVEVFAENLRHLLLAPPLGEKSVLAIDPGIRTGCKVAMLDNTGKYLGQTVVYPQAKAQEAARTIALIVNKYKVEAVAVGNGTAGRETEEFVNNTLALLKKQHPEIPTPMVVSVSESGASIYSASEVAREEFPDLDLTVRGAISIGRRLQDPLAELVKLDPKSIGVGQYQHDVDPKLLGRKLDEVVVSCVNAVGVELNTASTMLLTRVSGVGPALAREIVAWRNEHGKFRSREDLKLVKGMGPKAFEQCAGFLRIRDAANPLDASAVHPERYALVERMAADVGCSVRELVGSGAAVGKIAIKRYVGGEVGEMTLKDILGELAKPGRDPRAEFTHLKFRDDVKKIEDLEAGMKLEGIVTNVTKFGAFVDIGVHQDGMVHISELSDRYVSDASEVVKAGDIIKVTVVSVDVPRKRIALSARTRLAATAIAGRSGHDNAKPRSYASSGFSINPFANL